MSKTAKSKPEYPRVVHVLTSNYNVRKVTLARPYSESFDWGGYTASNRFYRKEDIFPTRAAAIKAGRSKLKRLKKNLDAALERVMQHSAALDKAEGIA